ncbi:hypothetical protein RG959_10015 [Domibacillus sp. 8LH]|uniref:IDEAL domain-containing protein n=1 Tax=Domibacillus sp. 8LH TaxID=3073900 RepID=UPI003176DAA9
MQVGDWVLAGVGRNWYLSYIDSFSSDGDTVHITRIARSAKRQPVWIEPLPATCHKSLVSATGITMPPEDHMEISQLMIDLALQTGDKQWFEELMGGEQKWHTVEQ